MNGHVTQRLQLRPGDYDMNDLPLSAGANDISLVIVDDLGNKRTLKFSVFSGRSLLAPGISEWALSAGVVSRLQHRRRDAHNLYSDLEYDTDTPVITGYYERGLTPDLTRKRAFAGRLNTAMGGAGAAFQTAVRLLRRRRGGEQSRLFGAGIAGRISYDLSNIEGADGIQRSFRLAVTIAARISHRQHVSTCTTTPCWISRRPTRRNCRGNCRAACPAAIRWGGETRPLRRGRVALRAVSGRRSAPD